MVTGGAGVSGLADVSEQAKLDGVLPAGQAVAIRSVCSLALQL